MMSIVPDHLKEEVSIITRGEANNLSRLRQILSSSGKSSWDVSVQILKEELRNEGRGQISYTELENAIVTNNTHNIIKLLQELFLDEITKYDIDIMKKYITSKSKLKELYSKANNNDRFIFSVMSI